MQIGIDISTLVNHGQDIGAGRYIYNLVENLLEIDNVNSYLLTGRYLNNDYLGIARELTAGYPDSKVRLKLYPVTQKKLKYWNLFRFPPYEFLGTRTEVMHFPDFLVSPTLNRNIVLTINDLAFVRFPEFNFGWFIKKYTKEVKKNARRARKIIAISESTKKDIVNFFSVNPAKIEVIYPAAGKIFRKLKKEDIDKSIPDKYNTGKKYILSVGTIEPRKNYVALIEAYNALREEYDTDIRLVIVGRTGWKSEATYQKRDDSPYREDILFLGRVEDRDLVRLYNQAELFVYPSVFEGFGLPPLEAMSCGLPVIVSNASSLPEVVGGAGILVPPKNTGRLASAIRDVLEDNSLKEKLSSKSIKQASRFSWEENARKTLKVYRQALGH
ncbi:MAG: glycosyltransferase family 4 protein [Actinomycetota bacterium]